MYTSEFTVEFTPLPEEMEDAYWDAIRYFAEVMFADLPQPHPDPLLKEREKDRGKEIT